MISSFRNFLGRIECNISHSLPAFIPPSIPSLFLFSSSPFPFSSFCPLFFPSFLLHSISNKSWQEPSINLHDCILSPHTAITTRCIVLLCAMPAVSQTKSVTSCPLDLAALHCAAVNYTSEWMQRQIYYIIHMLSAHMCYGSYTIYITSHW